MKFMELIWLCKQKENTRSNQASIFTNSCTDLSKTQLFLVINIKEKIIFLFYIIFWYHDFQARQEKLHCKKWKMDHISKSQYVNSNPEGFLFAIPHQKFLKAMLQKSNNISCLAVVATYKKTIHRALYNQNKTSNHVIIFNDSISKFYQCCQ